MTPQKSHVRVVIVDDSVQYRTILRKFLEGHRQITVIGEAVNGIEALELILRVKPDVILMDFEMPLMDGMTALQHLMIHIPTPTIMFSRLTQVGTARCFDALKNGAVDFFCKDNLHATTSDRFLRQELTEKVLCASEVAMSAVEPIFPKLPTKSAQKIMVKTLVFCEECGSKEELIIRENEDQGGVICTSCGEYISLEQRNKYRRANCLSIIVAGEGAFINLLKLVPHLHQDMNGAILIIIDGTVEHVDAFTQYLDEISTVNVVRIRDGLSIQGGNCYVGCDNENIFLKPFSADYSWKCSGEFGDESFPVDKTIRSIAEIFKERSAVIFLSGKEQQGERGLAKLSEINGTIVVLDPAKCLNKQMVENILTKFNAITATDEQMLARIIGKIHFHYRDTIVTA
jgi:two-component system chemotaxis response regulator CheB